MIKYLLAISVIMNSVLIMTVTGIMPFLLFLSASLIILLLWYTKTLLNKISDINDDIEEMFTKLASFSDHVESIYSLEMFYGDETLASMIDHSRDMLDEINLYRQKFYLDSDIVEEEEINFDEEEKTEEE